MKPVIALLFGVLFAGPAASLPQGEGSARAAFLEASQAGDLPRMKRLMAPLVTTIGDVGISVDHFLELIAGCKQSFVGKALISWKCAGDPPTVVTVSLKDGPERVSLAGLSVIAVLPPPGAGGQDG